MIDILLKPKSLKLNLAIIFLSAFTPLALALISQYFFGFHPCDLCIYQRFPYIVIIIISAIGLYKLNHKILIFIIITSIFAYMSNVGLSFYHVGVESGWWKFGDCTADLDTSSIEALKNSILNAEIVRCDEVQFRFLGLSMAAWNLIYSVAACFYLSYLLYRIAKHSSAKDLMGEI